MIVRKIKQLFIILFIVLLSLCFVNVNAMENVDNNDRDKTIESLTTEELVESIIYNELNYIFYFSDFTTGIEKFKANNECYSELLKRLDRFTVINEFLDYDYIDSQKLSLLLDIISNTYLDSSYYAELLNDRSNIYAPNGTNVQYSIYGNNQISLNEASYYHNLVVSDFPSLINSCISPANDAYNSHSYAWYMQNANDNHYWISYPDSYLDDDSYYEVINVRSGDILCYYAYGWHNVDGVYVNGEYISHSAIVLENNGLDVTDIDTLENVNLISKWNLYGVYVHNGDECPYGNLDSTFEYVKAYRPRVNYSYTLSEYSTTKTRTFSPNGLSNDILDKYEMYELNVNYQKNYPINVSSSYPLDVRLYDEHMQVLINNPTNTYNSGTYSVSINQNLSVGRYYLRVAYKNTSYSGTITTQIVGHTHSYNNSYTWLNYNQHRAYCTCGNSHTELHVASAKSLGDDLEYVTCILCGGPANAGIVPGMKGIQVTENGSFISPNGTLVLATEDIDSYLSGEIVFEHEDVEITRNINIPPYIVRKDEYNEEDLV